MVENHLRESPEERPAGLEVDLRADVLAALDAEDRDAIRASAGELHVADLADLIEQLGHDGRRLLIEALGRDLDPELLSELHGPVLTEVLDLIGPREAAAALSQLETDDAVYVLNEFDDEQQREVLAELPAEDRQALQAGLAYP